jgi:phosphoglycerate kinase
MGDINEETKSKFAYLKEGEIILLENIRFFEGENKNDDDFAKKLASLGDIYVNDAFSCSHREQASIHKITKYIKESYAGPLLKKEIEAINAIIQNKKKPVTCIIGGSKISTKINVINNLIKNVDNVIIVGAMANNFLTFKGFIVGKSLVEKETKEIINKIYAEAKKNDCSVFIPEDCSVSTNFGGSGKIKDINSISKDEMILDIGPKTIKKIESIIDQSNTILWNGPAGYFENTNFSTGTISIAKKISETTARKSLISILGGGDTISAINKSKDKFAFTHLSTAGGAFLEFLEGKDLPGLNVLK